MAGMGSEMEEGGSAERRVRCAVWSCLGVRGEGRGSFWSLVLVLEPEGGEDGNTMPGESSSMRRPSTFTSRRAVVTPASAPIGQAVLGVRERRDVSALITLLLPTFG